MSERDTITLTEYYDLILDEMARDLARQTGWSFEEMRAYVEIFRNVVGVEQPDGSVKYGVADPATFPDVWFSETPN